MDTTYKEQVLAKSRTIERLSRDIAAAVKKALVKNRLQRSRLSLTASPRQAEV